MDHGNYLVWPLRPVCGIEAEFHSILDGEQWRPEDIFGVPGAVFPSGQVRWRGKPLALPHGGVVYFDRGAIEVVTPPIELSQDASREVVQCLFSEIFWLRQHLDIWEDVTRRSLRMRGYSAHYNISSMIRTRDTTRQLAHLSYLLCHIITFPVIMLATNHTSTGVGVRPRRNRIEITVDFTPEPKLMTATMALLLGIVSEVMRWKTYTIEELSHRSIPLLSNFCPRRHSSREGWLAHASCFPVNPFTANAFHGIWDTQEHGRLSLSQISESIVSYFWPSIQFFSRDCADYIWGLVRGSLQGLRGSATVPDSYENVCGADGKQEQWSPDRYASILAHCYLGRAIKLNGILFRPLRILGWFVIELQEEVSGRTRIVTLDELIVSD